MKAVSAKEYIDLKNSGAIIKKLKPVKVKPKIKYPAVEQSLATLTAQVSSLVKNNSTNTSMEYITTVLAKTVEKINEVHTVKNWDIKVLRDKSKVITSLRLRAL